MPWFVKYKALWNINKKGILPKREKNQDLKTSKGKKTDISFWLLFKKHQQVINQLLQEFWATYNFVAATSATSITVDLGGGNLLPKA